MYHIRAGAPDIPEQPAEISCDIVSGQYRGGDSGGSGLGCKFSRQEAHKAYRHARFHEALEQGENMGLRAAGVAAADDVNGHFSRSGQEQTPYRLRVLQT